MSERETDNTLHQLRVSYFDQCSTVKSGKKCGAQQALLMLVSAALILVLHVVAPCRAAGAAPVDRPLNFTVVDCDQVLKGPEGKRCWLVEKPGEWKWVSNQYPSDSKALTLPADTDLRKHTVIVIDYGLATTAVHLSIDGVLKTQDGLVVETAVRIPGPGVPSDGKPHRLLQVVRCNKTAGPLIVRVKYQEYDSLGFIRDKPGLPAGREIFLRPDEPGKPTETDSGAKKTDSVEKKPAAE